MNFRKTWLVVILLAFLAIRANFIEKISLNLLHLQVNDALSQEALNVKQRACVRFWNYPVKSEQEFHGFQNLNVTCYTHLLKSGAFSDQNRSKWQMAESFLRTVVKSSPIDVSSQYALAAYLVARGDQNEAADILQSIAASPELSKIAKGWVNYWLAKTNDNQRFYQNAVDLNPQLIGAYYELYRIADQQGDMSEKARLTRFAAELKPTIAINSIVNNNRKCLIETDLNNLPEWSDWVFTGVDIDPILQGESPFVWVTFFWELNSVEKDMFAQNPKFELISNQSDHQVYRIGDRVFEVMLVQNLIPNSGFEWLLDEETKINRPLYFTDITSNSIEFSTSIIYENNTQLFDNHMLEIVTDGIGTWEPGLSSLDFPIEPGQIYIQGGTLQTENDATLINLGRKQSPPDPGFSPQPGLSWGVYQISTNGVQRKCMSFFESQYATQVKAIIAVVDFPGKTFADNLFFFKLPTPTWQ